MTHNPSLFSGMQFPATRLRRMRSAAWVRDIFAEHRISAADLIWPVFIIEGQNAHQDIPSMPGIRRYTVDLAVDEIRKAADLGIRAVALFPATPPALKTPDGSEALNPDNLICRAVRAIKKTMPDIGIITDVALDPYTSHGHDGLMEDGKILNDPTVQMLVKQSINQVQAGADVIAPSDMMDGRIGAIRAALESAGHTDTLILSYAAKYASSFYEPFRDAVGSGGALKGDKKTYQMNPANTDEALREVAMDIAEGADMVMVKPGMPYLDVIRRVKDTFKMPTLAYHVSGEYAMLKAAAQNGWLDYDAALMESLICFKRAGCDAVMTYGAVDAARIIGA